MFSLEWLNIVIFFLVSSGKGKEPPRWQLFALTVRLNLCDKELAKRDIILICYSGVNNKLFSNLANASLIQNWFWNMSSVSFSLCFL